MVSMLDNAKGLDGDDPTNPFSRGLLIAVDEVNMKAEIAAHYDHPDGDGGLAFRRGNYQPLPNGNVFMCWSEQALQSEHSKDGTMLMQARLKVDWLGTYRAYKFPFVGMPDVPPDVVGEVKELEKDGQDVTTAVYASWNGATEVVSPKIPRLRLSLVTRLIANQDSWNLYRTTKYGKPRILVDNQAKSGFETTLQYDGYASYIIAEAIAANGSVLGKSKLHHIAAPKVTTPAVEEELAWQEDPSNNPAWYESPLAHAAAVGLFACAFCTVIFVVFRRFRRRAAGVVGGTAPRKSFFDILSRGRYAKLSDDEKEFRDREGLMNGRRGRRAETDDDVFADDLSEVFELEEESGDEGGDGKEDFRRR